MSKQKRNKPNPETVWRLTFEGTYRNKANEEKLFKVEVLMQQKHTANGAALSVFKKHLAEDVMPPEYPDYVSLVKFRLTNTVNENDPDSPPDDIHLMNREQLIEYIDANELHIITSLCANIESLRTAILEYEEDPEAFVKNQKLMYDKRGPSVETRESVKLLNLKSKAKPAAAPPQTLPPKAKTPDPVDAPPAKKDDKKEKDVLAGV